MHTHAGPLVLSFAPHAPLPSCLAAWAEHRNCFCFVFIALSGRPLSLSPCVCVLLYGSNECVCAGRPTLVFFFLVLLLLLLLWLRAPLSFIYLFLSCLDCGRPKCPLFDIFLLFLPLLLGECQSLVSLSRQVFFFFLTCVMRQLIYFTLRPALLLVLLLMMSAMLFFGGCLAVSLTCPSFLDDLLRTDGAWASLVIVRDAFLRAQDASRVCGVVCEDRWVPVRIQASSTDREDSIRHCGFFWCCTKNLLDGAFVFNLLQLLWGKVGV
ncbi:hypothetical protein, conserved [Trypanosoma cruzi]|uniref:Uncharacterized protein n=1 Tax=Trypanosoma cruzi (strain CL Brener) TaxID=353153 RepID=Q4DJL1_TRYCC|nr:uncharacterized protein Tc00.1047053505025.80 [Trypanosoma cruzi]EAN92713.1 hypothetical protein, conserved [Trypanosoma cruzi]|eukprot:XP_814564.1 hypothetical protein Tc00.1047053505025.80 [Trypanosoma cruzi strain CL Brener]